MTVNILRPNGTGNNNGTVITGAGGVLHTALSDNSDASYAGSIATVDNFAVNMGTFTLPAGAVVKQYVMRGRASRTSAGTSTIGGDLYVSGSAAGSATVSVVGTSLVTSTWVAVSGALTQAEIDGLMLNVRGSGGTSPELVQIYELYLDVTYVAIPVVAPSAPTGTVTTNLPTVTWPAPTLDSDGGVQTKYQVKFFTAAQYGIGGFTPASSPNSLDSGELSGADLSWVASTELPEAVYRAYVRVGQTVNGATHWGDWAYTGFTVDTPDPPAAPSVTLTAQPDDGRIRLALATGGGAVSANAFEIERSLDGGTTWELLRTVDGDGRVLSGANISIYDFEAPNGEPVDYRARALHDYSGVYMAGAWTTVSDTEWSSTAQWIKHPTGPDLNMVVAVDAQAGHQRTVRQGVFQPLGRTDTVVVTDTRGPATGTVVLRLDTVAKQDDLDALLDSGVSLLLQYADGDQRPDRWVRFGDHDRAALLDKSWMEATLDTLPFTEVARPAGNIDAWP